MSDREPIRISLGPIVTALGAILLLVALFLDWFEPGFSAWTGFEVWDLVLALLALAAIAAAARHTGLLRDGPGLPLWLPGAIALAIVASQLINHPPAADGADKLTGAWLALAASAVMALGWLLSRVRFALVSEEPRRAAPVPPAREPSGDTAVAAPPGTPLTAPAETSATRKLPETGRTSPDSPA
jgi:hypothetical protein